MKLPIKEIKQLERIKIVQTFYIENGIMPTLRQICALLGWSSTNSAVKFSQKAIEEGYLKKVGRRLAPTDKFNEL